MTELKPCPFCGGEARICAKHFTDGTAYAWVECGRCHAKSRYSDFSEDLNLAWNARAERTCRPETVSVSYCEDAVVCSACKTVCDDLESCYYCPNCGARVVEVDA